MSKVILMLNDGVYCGKGEKNVFELDKLKELIVEWNGGKNEFRFSEEEEDVVNVDELMEMCEDEWVCVYEENMVEMGDDFVELMLVKLIEG